MTVVKILSIIAFVHVHIPFKVKVKVTVYLHQKIKPRYGYTFVHLFDNQDI